MEHLNNLRVMRAKKNILQYKRENVFREMCLCLFRLSRR